MAVLFDLDGTILGAKEDKSKVLSRCAREAGAPQIERSEYYRTFEKLIQRGKIDTRKPIFTELLHNPNLVEELLEKYRRASLENTFVYPDAKEILQNLPGKKGLVTNGPRLTQQEKIKKFNLSKYFDTIIISGEVGIAKPDPRIFQLALNSINSSSADSFYVGDYAELDVIGAKNAGLKSILINRHNNQSEVKPDYEIQDLRELYKIIKG